MLTEILAYIHDSVMDACVQGHMYVCLGVCMCAYMKACLHMCNHLYM